ncbi:MAG: SRPBCC domain-containing protein [Anaerolineaceae bacterium]|nr:SRPBCC domain-containing protein [Anaerolineaceae bacterium]
MTVQDTIERAVVFPVSRDRVWTAITDPSQLEKWFGTKAEFKRLVVGEPMLFGWGPDEIYRGRIEVVEPMHHFAYRWNSGKSDMETPFDDMPTTLVTFRLEDLPEGAGTRLTLVESGFASLPDNLRDKQWQENRSGWDAEIADLAAHLGVQKEVK